MKNLVLYCSCLLLVTGMISCNGTGTTNKSDSTAATNTQMNPNDSSVTTTTTTTVTHHRYTGSFVPQATTKYLDLQTNKRITVRIDTVRGELVNTETDQPVNLIVEPTTHDTIYGETGSVVNNYIVKDESGGYRVDTVRVHDTVTQTQTVPVPVPVSEGKGKMKTKGDKLKEKTK